MRRMNRIALEPMARPACPGRCWPSTKPAWTKVEATFETTAPGWAEFRAGHLAEHSYVALDPDGTVLGWVSASPVSDRCAYAGVVEHSVYVLPLPAAEGSAEHCSAC